MVDWVLGDSRNTTDPLPLQKIPFTEPATAQYIKFELVSWWGNGGGLQYFDIGEELYEIKI